MFSIVINLIRGERRRKPKGMQETFVRAEELFPGNFKRWGHWKDRVRAGRAIAMLYPCQRAYVEKVGTRVR